MNASSRRPRQAPQETESPRLPSGEIKTGDKAAAVLAGASSVFLAHGFSAASTDMIQRATGVSKATVYSLYPTKEALFVAVIEAECAAFIATVRELRFPSRHPHDVLMALARAYLAIVLSPRALDLFRVIIAEAPRFPELARQFYLAGPRAFNELVAKHLDEIVKDNKADFSLIGRDVAARLFANLVRGELQLQSLTHPGAVPSAAQRDEWAEAAVTTFIRAYGK